MVFFMPLHLLGNTKTKRLLGEGLLWSVKYDLIVLAQIILPC